jgi:hypothetical protein
MLGEFCKAAAAVVLVGASFAANAASIAMFGALQAHEVGDIVNDMTLFELQPMTAGAGGGIAPFTAPHARIDLDAPGGIIHEADGFVFELLAVDQVARSERSCRDNACLESVSVIMSGSVSGNGVDAMPWLGRFAATGACLMDGDTCDDASKVATWSVSITSPALTPMPVPGSLALLALGLLGIYARRRA